MDTIGTELSPRELSARLLDVLGRAMYGGERIGITRNGRLAAVVIGAADLEALERFETPQDAAASREAKVDDDGARVPLEESRGDLAL